MKTIAALLLCIGCLQVQSQEHTAQTSYASIPEKLKEGANAIYRLDDAALTIISNSEYILNVHQIITVLNAEGAGYLRHRFRVDKFRKLEELDVKMYDAFGLPVQKFTQKNCETEAPYDGITLVTDDKILKLSTPAPSYPCTVDVQYKLHATGYIDLPNWFIDYHKTATELFRYKVSVPVGLDIRQRTVNMNITPVVETLGTTKQYTWETKDIAAKRLESDGFESALYLPQVEVGPNEFSYDGYKGDFRTWAGFGAWNYKLYEEKSPFSQARIAGIKELVKDAHNRQEVIGILYRYLQQNMRYVSIQLGIGGFKPFAVKFVDEMKYGDCKALTNYMRYLLLAVGINSYPALINAGYNKIPADPQFPSDPFNHVILCIPSGKDTTWLECTSNNNKAGELGTFTENKKALLLTEQGGVLVNTPKSMYRANSVTTKSEVMIDANGSGTVHSKIWISGEATSFYKYMFQLKEDEQKEMLVKWLHYKNPDDFSLSNAGNKEQSSFEVNRSYNKIYDFKTGDKYFFPMCVEKLVSEGMKVAQRETDFVSEYPYEKTDTTVYQFPAGFALQSPPADKELQGDYSQYKRSCRYDSATNQLTVVSSFALIQQVIPAAAYTKHARFVNDIVTAEEENFVLTKQEQASASVLAH